MKKRFKHNGELEGISSFRYEDHTYQPLNLSLDVETDGMIYHLSSEFAGKDEMGAVIDFIELERNRRDPA